MQCHTRITPAFLWGLAVFLLTGSILYAQDLGYFVDESVARLPPITIESRGSDLADIDGDGDLDILLGTEGQDLLLLNQGGLQGGQTGVYADETATRLPPNPQGTINAYFVDIDNDGDPDLLLGQVSVTRPALLINQGNLQGGPPGFFLDASHRLPDFSSCNRMDFGDIDSDGDTDIVGVEGGNYVILINVGGAFQDQTADRLPVLPDGYHGAFTLGDVDGDVDLDLFLANTADGGMQNQLFINNGLGYFSEETSLRLPAVLDQSINAVFGDVDLDGDSDILVLNPGNPGDSNLDRLLINNGSGYFTDETGSRLPPVQSQGSQGGEDGAIVDVNLDGFPDIVIGSITWPQYRCLINDGTGFYTDETTERMPDVGGSTMHVSAGDVDDDGDTDFLFPGSALPTRLLINQGPPGGQFDIAYFYVQRRVTEDGRDFNRLGFAIRDGAGNYPTEDVLTSVSLYDPDGFPVVLPEVGFLTYETGSGRYDEATGMWEIPPEYHTENYYRAEFADSLKVGQYRLEVIDIHGHTHERYYDFNGILDLPLISAATVTSSLELGDLVFTWPVPDLSHLDPVPETSVRAIVYAYLQDGTVVEYYIRIPTDLGMLRLPAWFLEYLIGLQTERLDVTLQLRSNDNNNRSYSNPVAPASFYIDSFYVQHRVYEDGLNLNRLHFVAKDGFGRLLPLDAVITADSPMTLLNGAGQGLTLTDKRIIWWNAAFGRFDGTVLILPDEFHEESFFFADITEALSPGTHRLSVTGLDTQEQRALYHFSGHVPLPIITADTFLIDFDVLGNLNWQWHVPDLSGLNPVPETSIRAMVQVFEGEAYVGEYYLKVPTNVGHLSLPAERLTVGNRLGLRLQLRTNDNNNRTYSNFISVPMADADTDGIENVLDDQPNQAGIQFSDGTTGGTIVDRADQILAVTDAAESAAGVHLVATGGLLPATVEACSGVGVFTLDANDSVVVTCSSVHALVTGGEVDIILTADNGTVTSVSLDSGSGVSFEPESGSVTAAESNPDPIIVVVDGVEVPVEPGASVIVDDVTTGCTADCNGDGNVDGRDIRCKSRESRKTYKSWVAACWNSGEACGDVNYDGRVTFRDRIQKYLEIVRDVKNWIRDCWRPARRAS